MAHLTTQAASTVISQDTAGSNSPSLDLSPLTIERCDEAACKLDGMFRDLFNTEERTDLIITILRAAA